MRIRDGGWIGNGRPGGEGMFLAGGHVGGSQGYFCCAPGGYCQTPALHGGKMATYRVHCFNRRAAGDQSVIRRLQVFKTHARDNRELGQRGASTGEEKKNDGVLVGPAEQRENRLRRPPTF